MKMCTLLLLHKKNSFYILFATAYVQYIVASIKNMFNNIDFELIIIIIIMLEQAKSCGKMFKFTAKCIS